ncbi:hypothetical protein AZO1586I_379, partial [Bathymodiolus thermophilus thioautotrophic gill symbiont]
LNGLHDDGKIGGTVDSWKQYVKSGDVVLDLAGGLGGGVGVSKVVKSVGKAKALKTVDTQKQFIDLFEKNKANNQITIGNKRLTALPIKRSVVDKLKQAVEKSRGEQISKLTDAQGKNFKRFQKKIPRNAKENIKIYKDKNGNTVFEATSPGKVLGSKAVYKKTINSRGNTIDYKKATYDPKNQLIHNKDKFNVKK